MIRPTRTPAVVIKRALLLLLLTGGTLTKPNGWTATDSQQLADQTSQSTHFGADQVPGTKIAAMQITPADPNAGVTLFATRIEMKLPNDPAAIRAEVDTFHGAAKRAALGGANIVEQAWQEQIDDKTKQVVASLAFHDETNKVTTVSRLVIGATADTLIAVTGECLGRDDADAAAFTACKTSLSTLDPGGTHVAVSLAPAGTPPPDREHAGKLTTGPSMSESHIPVPPMVIQPQTRTEADRRPVFIGAGIVLLALVFWWNMKRKERLEEEEHD